VPPKGTTSFSLVPNSAGCDSQRAVRQSGAPLQAMDGQYTDGIFHRQAIPYSLKHQDLRKKSVFEKRLHRQGLPRRFDTARSGGETVINMSV
jgi:hypothetical protein